MIVVGWDGAEGGADALELGKLMAASLGLRLLRAAVIVPGASPHTRWEIETGADRTVIAPSVAQGLSEIATEVGAHALVVGSSRRGRIGRTLFGSGIEQLAQAAPCPLAVAPHGYAGRYATRLIDIDAEFDGSEAGERAVELAGRIAARERGTVRVLTSSELRDRAERCLASLPGDVAGDVETDRPPRIEETRGRRADMLVLGGRSNSRARRGHAAALLLI